jgi:hypothetical protein
MRFLLPLLLVAHVPGANADVKTSSLEYRTSAGVTYVVSADGLNEVRLGDRILARGSWRFRAGDARWGLPKSPDEEAINSKSLELISPQQALVTHKHADVLARYTYTFSGEDLRIEAWIENRHPTAPIRVTWFEGPRVAFGRVPRGILPNYHVTYSVANGIPMMHPGGIRIGGSFAIGDGFGIGVAPHDAGVHPMALLWDYDWSPGKREADPNRIPNLFVNAPVPSRGARTFAITFRFSPDTDWKHLLDPYRRHLHATLGDKTLYNPISNLPFVAGFANGAESSRSPTNPYGYHADHRLDSPNGLTKYHAYVGPRMRWLSAQGLVVWGQAGQSPRNAMYRPDFDVLPPDVVPNIIRLGQYLKDQGMLLGVAARPGQMATSLDWTNDTVVDVDPARRDHMELLARRFNNMIGLGSTVFYLDSMGNRIDDVAMMRALRTGVGKQAALGRNIQTLVEHPSDVVVPYTGLLPVLWGKAAEGKFGLAFEYAFNLNPPTTPSMAEVIRYFYPDVAIVVLIANGVDGVDSAARQRDAVEYCYKRRMAVMIPDHWLGDQTINLLVSLTQRYMTPEGKWKDKPD